VQCEQVDQRLPGLAEDTRDGSRRARAHLRRCLRCQAELARYRRLRRACRTLADTPVQVPDDLLAAVLARLEHPTTVSSRPRRTTYLAVAATAATAAAGAAGALVLGRRRHHPV
jgi:anti-sigma factor RsiW